MKHIISMILILTLITSTMALVSCAIRQEAGNGSNNTDVTTKNENGDDPTALPKMDFEGYTVKFAVSPVNNGDKTSLAYLSCDADENDGSVIASSVYQRNRKVEELLNVKIEVVYTSQNDEFRSTIMDSVNSGKNEYDVIMSEEGGMRLAAKGCIMNVKLIENSHIDLTADWWDSDYIEGMHYADEVFWLASPLSLTYAGGLGCFFVNMDMYNAQLKDTYGDIYDMVREGKWTFDKLTAMSAVVYDPVNPNAIYASDEDVMGLRIASTMTRSLVVGMGVYLSSEKTDGSGVDLALTTLDRKIIDPIDALYNKLNESNKVGIVNAQTPDTVAQFAAGKQLFHGGCLVDTANVVEKSSFEIGIIPNPMFNEEQKEYRTSVHGNAQVMGIAAGCENTAAVSATLDYMARLSSIMVEDVFYRNILGEKYASDENVIEMIETLKNSKYVDFVMCYQVSILGSYWLRSCIIYDVGRHIYSRRFQYNDSYAKFLIEYVPNIGSGSEAVE